MGFSGGVKTAAIGLAGRETINANHSLMLDPRSDLARYEDNPCRQDVEEIGQMIGVQFALNGVLNEAKKIVRVFAGNPRAVMEQGIPLVREIYEVHAEQPFDLMIVSPGGHPKDINLLRTSIFTRRKRRSATRRASPGLEGLSFWPPRARKERGVKVMSSG
jgi:nickel-dependent lactate racemase